MALARELQRVPADIAHAEEDLRSHVIVRQDDRVLLTLQAIDARDERRVGRPLDRGDDVLHALIKWIGLGFDFGRVSEAPFGGGVQSATFVRTAPSDLQLNLLLDGTGGLPLQQAAIILGDLSASTPKGLDGYPQRFGIPDGFFAEPVAVKQGWMPGWNGNNWLHMSTGVIGADRRFVFAIGSMQPVDDATARDTVTQAIKTMFPAGRI